MRPGDALQGTDYTQFSPRKKDEAERAKIRSPEYQKREVFRMLLEGLQPESLTHRRLGHFSTGLGISPCHILPWWAGPGCASSCRTRDATGPRERHRLKAMSWQNAPQCCKRTGRRMDIPGRLYDETPLPAIRCAAPSLIGRRHLAGSFNRKPDGLRVLWPQATPCAHRLNAHAGGVAVKRLTTMRLVKVAWTAPPRGIVV